jgi:hypothetical protein
MTEKQGLEAAGGALEPARAAGKAPFLAPACGILILLLDWVLFSGTVFSAGLSLPVSIGAGFLAGTAAVTLVQYFQAGDSLARALLKGLIGGVAVGLPFPIAGTVAGGWILALSGMRRNPEKDQPG